MVHNKSLKSHCKNYRLLQRYVFFFSVPRWCVCVIDSLLKKEKEAAKGFYLRGYYSFDHIFLEQRVIFVMYSPYISRMGCCC